jgi:hypothetical protein
MYIRVPDVCDTRKSDEATNIDDPDIMPNVLHIPIHLSIKQAENARDNEGERFDCFTPSSLVRYSIRIFSPISSFV